jgi:integrase
MASIEQRGDSWRVYWRQGGRGGPKQSSTWDSQKRALHAKTIAEAHKHRIDADEVFTAVTGVPVPGHRHLEPAPPTVTEWADLWLATKTRIAPGTAGRYRQQLRDHILPAFGQLPLDEVEGSHIALLLNELRKHYKDTTVTRYYACVHAMFAYAVLERKIPDNPARRTDWVRDLIAHDDTDDGEHVYLAQEEFALICSQADPFAEPVLRVLAGTGLRYSEATAIAVAAVNLAVAPPTVRVHQAWKKDDAGRWYLGATKGRKRRTISVGPQLGEQVMAPLVGGRRGEVLLLRAKRGGRLDYANFRFRYWEPAVDAAMRCPVHPPDGVGPDGRGVWPRGAVSGCDCPIRLHRRPTLHDLRHSFVAWQIAAGVPIVAISQHIGHSTTTITEQVYAGILPKVHQALAVAADTAMAGAVPVARGG